MKKYLISAYTASPSFHQWNEKLETQYFQSLGERHEIIGIEHPFFLHSNKWPLAWMLENTPHHWSIAITMLPIFMERAKDNPFLGLASTKEEERKRAVGLMKEASKHIEEINSLFGRQIVKAVHFHSFPGNSGEHARGNKNSLKASLGEIKKLNWHGLQLNLEHCDALVAGQTGDKEFLPLEDELEALKEVGGFGIILNWARSAIEGRSVATPLQHIAMAQKEGLLRGFFFSGCTQNGNSDYGAWRDRHMPPQKIIKSEFLRDESLLGAEEIQQTMNALRGDIYLGIKVLDPNPSKKLSTSIGLNIDTLRALHKASQDCNNKEI